MAKAYLELAEIEQLEQAANYLRDRLLVRLLSRMGCRISEALALKVEDIDFERRTVMVLHLKRSMKILCPQCSVRLSRTAKFCPGCGSRGENHFRIGLPPLVDPAA